MVPVVLRLLALVSAASTSCEWALRERDWATTPDPWAELAGAAATPFLLTGSPVNAWAALHKWSPEFLSLALAKGGVPNVRRSRDPRFLYYVVDQFSAELARNEEFWQRVDSGDRVLGDSVLAQQTFRWSRPHQMHANVSASRFARGLAGLSLKGEQRSEHHVYAQMSINDATATAAARALLRDVQPLGVLGASQEGDPFRKVACHTPPSLHDTSYARTGSPETAVVVALQKLCTPSNRNSVCPTVRGVHHTVPTLSLAGG
jgi:hypothetical protein